MFYTGLRFSESFFLYRGNWTEILHELCRIICHFFVIKCCKKGTFSRLITCRKPFIVIEQLVNWRYEVKIHQINGWFLYNRNKRHRESIILFMVSKLKRLQIGVQSLVVKKHSSNEETCRLFIYSISNNFSCMFWTIDTSNLP